MSKKPLSPPHICVFGLGSIRIIYSIMIYMPVSKHINIRPALKVVTFVSIWAVHSLSSLIHVISIILANMNIVIIYCIKLPMPVNVTVSSLFTTPCFVPVHTLFTHYLSFVTMCGVETCDMTGHCMYYKKMPCHAYNAFSPQIQKLWPVSINSIVICILNLEKYKITT